MLYSLTQEVLDAAEDRLKQLQRHPGVTNSILMDGSGHVLLSTGRFPFLPPIETATIVVASYSALMTLSTMTAARNMTVRFHHSPLGGLMLYGLTSRVLLVVNIQEQVADDAIRPKVEAIALELKGIFEAYETQTADRPSAPPLSSIRFIEDKLDDILQDLDERF